MFSASRNINVLETTRMMAHQQRAVRRRHRDSPSSASNSSGGGGGSRSGTKTPKASNVAFRSTSDVNFDEIWGDLVADHKIFPTEDQSSHHPSQVDILQSRLLGQKECQVGKSDFEEGRARATNGEYSEAVDLFTRALTSQQNSNLDENSPYIARTLVERGNASAALGKLYDAVLDLEKALLIERRASGSSEYESLGIADSYLRVGALQHRRGNFIEAIHCFECALAIRQRVLGDNDPRVIKLVSILAVAYHRRRDYQSALEYYSKAMVMIAAEKRANPSRAKECMEEYAWLRRCVADKNLYYNRVENYWEDHNAI